MELWAPEGLAAPLHIHRNEDEFFIVLSGEIRVQHGDEIIDAVEGSFVYGPRGVPHRFRIDSAEARLLFFFGPAGIEGFFRGVSKEARSAGLPPSGEEFMGREELMAVGAQFATDFVGPPLDPR